MGWRAAIGISVTWVALAFVGDGLTSLVLPAMLAGMPDPATSIGLISFAGLGLGLLAMPVAGRLSDRLRGRVDRRTFMAVAAMPALAGLAMLATSGGRPWLAAAAYLVAILSGSAIQASLQTLIPEHVQESRRGRASSLKTAFDIGGAFVAFLLLGWALETSGVAGAAVASAGVMLSALLLVFGWVPRRARKPDRVVVSPPTPVNGPVSVPDGFWPLVLSRFLFLLGIYVVGRFLLLLVAERLGLPAAAAAPETGGILATFTLLTAVTALALGPLVDRVGRRRIMVAGAVIGAVGTASFLPDGGLPGVLVAGALMSLGTAAFATANWAALTDLSPPDDAGRLMGLANLGTGGAAASAGLFGPSIDAWGFTPALALATITVLAALAPVARIVPVHRMEESTT
jgi:MFS family permease